MLGVAFIVGISWLFLSYDKAERNVAATYWWNGFVWWFYLRPTPAAHVS